MGSDLSFLSQKLFLKKDLNIDFLRSHPKLSESLKKAEILLLIGEKTLAKKCLKYLSLKMKKHLDPQKDLTAFFYLNQLQYLSASYLESIRLITDLSKEKSFFCCLRRFHKL